MTPHRRRVFLDLGRVLIDLDLDRFRLFMESRTGIDGARLRELIQAGGLPARFELGLVSAGEFHREVCRRVGREIPFADFSAGWNSIFRPEPLVPESWIATICLNAPTWIVSNTNPIHFEFIRARYGFLVHVRGLILSYRVGAVKPDRRIFEIALREGGCRAPDAVFVDDHDENVQAACSLGIDAFRFEGRERFAAEMRTRGLL